MTGRVNTRSTIASMRGKRRGRVLAYCHDGVGLGHLRRTLNISEHVGREHPRTSFLVVTGSPYVSLLGHAPTVDFVKLPAIVKVDNNTYRSKFLPIPAEELLRCRSALLLQTAQVFEPDVLLVDKAPLGVCNELLPTLRWLRAHRPDVRIVFGMRDIEDAPEATIAEWTRRGVQPVLEACYDEVWVYGMRRVFDVAKEYRLSPAIRKKLRFVGYVTGDGCAHTKPMTNGHPRVLVTVGGGTDGESVLEAYLAHAAGRLSELGVRSTVVGGPDLPDEAAVRLRGRAGEIPGVEWLDFAPCLGCQIQRAELVVSMGGYNTLCEIATRARRSLVIPRRQPRLEQTIRAKLWERLGVVHTLDRDMLTPERLAEDVDGLLQNGHKMTAASLDMDGLKRVGRRFASMLDRSSRKRAGGIAVGE